MPKARASKIKAWSFSRFRDYDDCPRKARYKHVDKIQEPIPSPEDEPDHPLNRGSRIHKEAEVWLLKCREILRANIARADNDVELALPPLPESLETFTEEFQALALDAENIHVEQEWAFTRDWKITDWFSMRGLKAAWCRVKLDCAHLVSNGVVRSIDFKTGKCKPQMVETYIDQLSLYALATFLMFADVDEVQGELWFLDPGILVANGELTNPRDPNSKKYEGMTFTREKDFDRLMKRWENMTKPMLIDEVFAPNPTFRCSWCYFSNKKGGICEAG